MRVWKAALQQRTLPLEGRQGQWESLPEKVRKEAVALLSLLLLDYARAERVVEGRKGS